MSQLNPFWRTVVDALERMPAGSMLSCETVSQMPGAGKWWRQLVAIGVQKGLLERCQLDGDKGYRLARSEMGGGEPRESASAPAFNVAVWMDGDIVLDGLEYTYRPDGAACVVIKRENVLQLIAMLAPYWALFAEPAETNA